MNPAAPRSSNEPAVRSLLPVTTSFYISPITTRIRLTLFGALLLLAAPLLQAGSSGSAHSLAEPENHAAPVTSENSSYRILFLNAHASMAPWTLQMFNTARSEIEALTGKPVVMLMDNAALLDSHKKNDEALLAELLRSRYEGHIDFVIAHNEGSKIPSVLSAFTDVPVILPRQISDDSAQGEVIASNLYLNRVQISPAKTAKVALEVQPDVNNIIVISSNDAFGQALESRAQKELSTRFLGRPVEYWSGVPVAELKKRVALLPKDSLLLFLLAKTDRNGEVRFSADVVKELAAVSRVPVWGIASTYFSDSLSGYGIVGGYVDSSEKKGLRAAAMVAELGAGNRLPNVIFLEDYGEYQFDWMQMRRWGLSMANLPPGSRILNRPASFVERHRWAVPVLLSLALVMFAAAAFAVWYARLKHKQKEQLRQSEARFRSVVQDLTVLVCRTTPQGKIVFVNDAFAQYFKQTDTQLIGVSFMELLHQEGRDCAEKNLFSLTYKNPIKILEIKVRAPDGDIRYHRWTNRAIINAEGDVELIQAYGEDITVRKAAQDALHRSQKMEAIGQLSGGIAHDFNNQLGVVIGYLDFMREKFTSGEVHEWLGNATKAVQRSADLTKQLMAFSRKQEPERKVVDVNDYLKDIEHMIARSVTPSINVQYYLHESLWHTAIDPGQLQDAILNLVINARDAMPNGGDLMIETNNIDLDKSYVELNPDLQAGEYVQIMVSDTGTGMDADTIEHIFEPFFTTKPKGQGTGFGLAMVYAFVRRFEGDVRVYSELDLGTTIRLYFPRAPHELPNEEEATPDGADEAYPTGSETVLVVDDEIDLVMIAKRNLTALGYSVYVAQNAQQAMDILASDVHIDLLFSDVVMPGSFNGYELAEKATLIRPDLKVLLTSGFTSKKLIQNSSKNTFQDLLDKPYRKAELAKKVHEVLH